MVKELKFIQSLHRSSKRDYLARMKNKKVNCMTIAQKFGRDYWDGNRKFGYGGYKYIKGRWKLVAKNLIKKYRLSNDSRILDIGCGKGYLLLDIKKILPDIKVFGIDISHYAKNHAHNEIKNYIKVIDVSKKIDYKKNYFDLVISINTLHNLEIKKLKKALTEISRISKKSYLVVESYRNNEELFNLQCWALTCKSFFSKNEWRWIFKEFDYKGDYEFIYFK